MSRPRQDACGGLWSDDPLRQAASGLPLGEERGDGAFGPNGGASTKVVFKVSEAYISSRCHPFRVYISDLQLGRLCTKIFTHCLRYITAASSPTC